MIKSILNLTEIFFLFVLCALFFIMPKGVSEILIWACLSLFYAVFISSIWTPIVIAKNIKTFFKIDALFYVFYFIIYFLPYQLYVLGLKGLETRKFLTYEEHTNAALLLSTIGLLAFHLGFSFFKDKNYKKIVHHVSKKYISVLGIITNTLIALILLLFINTGASTLFVGAYAGSKMGSVTYDAIFSLVSLFIILGVLQAYSQRYFFGKSTIMSIAIIFIAVVWAFLLSVVGDRNTFFLVAIVLISVFFTYFRSISRLVIGLFIFFALFLYQFIEITRGLEQKNLEDVLEIYATFDESRYGTLPYETSFDTTTVGLRASVQVIEDEGFYYGKFKLVSIASLIPYSSRIFIDSDDEITGSSNAIKREMIGLDAGWGTGTNIISDSYMDFGVFGVVIIMYLFGLFGGYAQRKAQTQINSLKWMFIYILTLAYFSELPRYGFDFPLRAIVWTYLLFILINLLPGLRRNNSYYLKKVSPY